MTATDLNDDYLDLDQLPESDLDTDPAASYGRTRREAEGLLRLAAAAVELKHGTELAAIPDQRLVAMATVGAGFAQLAAIDWARQQADQNRTGEPDLIVDVLGDKWFAEHDNEGNYAAEEDPAKVFTASYIRSSWGPTREYVLRPPRAAG